MQRSFLPFLEHQLPHHPQSILQSFPNKKDKAFVVLDWAISPTLGPPVLNSLKVLKVLRVRRQAGAEIIGVFEVALDSVV